MLTDREEGLDDFSLRVGVIEHEIAFVESQSAGQDGEEKATKPIFIERSRGLDRLGVTTFTPDHVQTQRLVTESGLGLLIIKFKNFVLKLDNENG